MEKQKNIKKWLSFGDYTFEDTWIIVTDSNNCDVSVTEDELILFDMPVDPNSHVTVYYYGQKYWIPEKLHFPQ